MYFKDTSTLTQEGITKSPNTQETRDKFLTQTNQQT